MFIAAALVVMTGQAEPARISTHCGVTLPAVPAQSAEAYFRDAQSIWRTQVPRTGPSATAEGEMLRAVEKLRLESLDNGKGNWDVQHDQLAAYLKARLDDDTVFPGTQRAEIAAVMLAITDRDHVCLDDKPFDYLADRVVDYYRARGTQPREAVQALAK